MGMQVKSSPNGLEGPQTPPYKPTRSPGKKIGKKLDFSEAKNGIDEPPAAKESSSKPKGLSRFLPLPHVLDLRSLALFRILFGLLQLSDIYGRLSAGKYDLAWYTSDPPERSYYYPDMESQVFEGPLGKLFLFQRGSINQEIAFFVVYGILLIMLTIGYQCQNCWLLPMVWLFTNALISKGDAGSWGSDQLAQQLLIWMVFLPLSEEWSVDAWLRRKRGVPSRYSNHQVKSIACLGLVLLINGMYLECTLERTYHAFTWDQLHQSDWLWPDFPLVHYAANGSGTFNTWFTKIIRETAVLNQFMTFSGFMIELLMPPLCLIFNQRYSHWFAINLFLLHLGIGLIIAIPHFAAMGCLIHTIWIPTHVWDRWLGGAFLSTDAAAPADDAVAEYKKTDGDETTNEKTQTPSLPKESSVKKGIAFCICSTSFLLQFVCLCLFICSWLAANGWYLKYTGYPAGYAYLYLLMSNQFGMWSPGAERISPYTVFLGGRKREDGEYDVVNLFHFLKTGGEEIGFDGFTEEFLADTTYLYPSTRWEKAMGDDWEDYLSNEDTEISDNILRAWCIFINEDLEKLGRPPMDTIEIRLHLRPIGTPESGKRYSDEDEAEEGSLMRLCFEENEEAVYHYDDEEEYEEEWEEEEIIGRYDEF